MSLSAITDMSSAIRETVQSYAANLRQLSDSDLHDFVLITSAFAEDLRREEERRQRDPAQ